MLLATRANALISVMEGLATTRDAVFVGTTTPQLILNATSYNGTVPTVSLYTSSNVVIGSGCVLYATGTVTCLGVTLSSGPTTLGISTGVATTAALSGNGNSSSLLGVVSSSVAILSGGFVLNQQLDGSSVTKQGNFWIGNGTLTGAFNTRASSGTNGDQFDWRGAGNSVKFSTSVTFVSSITLQGTFGGIGIASGATTTAALIGTGGSAVPLGVISSSIAVYSGSYGLLAASIQGVGAGVTVSTQETHTSSITVTVTGVGNYAVLLSTSITFTQSAGNGLGVRWGDGTISTTAASGGSGAAGPAGAASTQTITWQLDNFLNLATGAQATFTTSQTPSSTAAVSCVLDGLLLSGASDYTFTMPNQVVITTTPARACSSLFQTNCTSSLFCQYTINTSTLPAVFILNSSQTVSGATIVLSSVTFGSVLTSTANYSSALINGCIVVASTNPAGATTDWSFSNIRSTWTYRVEIRGSQGGVTGNWDVRFNADSGSNYVQTIINTSGTGDIANSFNYDATKTTGLAIMHDATHGSPAANSGIMSVFSFSTPPGSGSGRTRVYDIQENWDGSGSTNYGNIYTRGTAGYYAAATSLNILHSAQAFTGSIRIWACIDSVGF